MKKKLIPRVHIRNGVFFGTNTPYFGITYNLGYNGTAMPCSTLEEAFDTLEKLAKHDGFTLDQCFFEQNSDYLLSDRPKALEQMVFDF